MKKTLINYVRIGVLDNNSEFVMSTFIEGMKMYFQAKKSENSEYISKIEIVGYEFLNDDDEIVLNLFSSDGIIYGVQSFSNEYIGCLNNLYISLMRLVSNYKLKSKSSLLGCNIYELSLIAKIAGNELFIPPIVGFRFHGSGNIIGHKYLKRGFEKTSKIIDIDSNICTITSTRTVYNILSFSKEYEKYLEEIISKIQTILKHYSR